MALKLVGQIWQHEIHNNECSTYRAEEECLKFCLNNLMEEVEEVVVVAAHNGKNNV